MPVVLTRLDTFTAHELPGSLVVRVYEPGTVTEFPVADAAPAADDVVAQAMSVTIESVEGAYTAGVDSGSTEAQVAATLTFLRQARTEGARLSLQMPRLAPIDQLVVQSIGHDHGGTVSVPMFVELKQVRVQSTSRVEVVRIPEPTAPNKADGDGADTKDTGTGATSRSSLTAQGVDGLLGFIGLGS